MGKPVDSALRIMRINRNLSGVYIRVNTYTSGLIRWPQVRIVILSLTLLLNTIIVDAVNTTSLTCVESCGGKTWITALLSAPRMR